MRICHRSVLVIVALAVSLFGCAQSAVAATHPLPDFGPIPMGIDLAPETQAKGITSPGYLTEADSGWFVKHDDAYRVDQCNILVDSVIGAPGQCFYRVSVMCVQEGVGYTRGFGQWNFPIAAPLILQLYQPPNPSPFGSIEIWHLNDVAMIGLNAAPTSNWYRAARYTGASCVSAANGHK